MKKKDFNALKRRLKKMDNSWATLLATKCECTPSFVRQVFLMDKKSEKVVDTAFELAKELEALIDSKTKKRRKYLN